DLDVSDVTRLATALRRNHPPDEASAIAEQLVLRARARARFGELPLALYSGPGLDMMTHPDVATRRAARLAAVGRPIADLTCGIGGDLTACAARGIRAVGVERDAATAVLASANAPDATVIHGDATCPPVALGKVSAILDPARRAGAKRTFDARAFAP